jgi:hypothetical protein
VHIGVNDRFRILDERAKERERGNRPVAGPRGDAVARADLWKGNGPVCCVPSSLCFLHVLLLLLMASM